jgi:hypothetical protein
VSWHFFRFPSLETVHRIACLMASIFQFCLPDTISIRWIGDCARLGAIRFQPHATVSGMNGILSETGLVSCYGFITTLRRTLV